MAADDYDVLRQQADAAIEGIFNRAREETPLAAYYRGMQEEEAARQAEFEEAQRRQKIPEIVPGDFTNVDHVRSVLERIKWDRPDITDQRLLELSDPNHADYNPDALRSLLETYDRPYERTLGGVEQFGRNVVGGVMSAGKSLLHDLTGLIDADTLDPEKYEFTQTPTSQLKAQSEFMESTIDRTGTPGVMGDGYFGQMANVSDWDWSKGFEGFGPEAGKMVGEIGAYGGVGNVLGMGLKGLGAAKGIQKGMGAASSLPAFMQNAKRLTEAYKLASAGARAAKAEKILYNVTNLTTVAVGYSASTYNDSYNEHKPQLKEKYLAEGMSEEEAEQKAESDATTLAMGQAFIEGGSEALVFPWVGRLTKLWKPVFNRTIVSGGLEGLAKRGMDVDSYAKKGMRALMYATIEPTQEFVQDSLSEGLAEHYGVGNEHTAVAAGLASAIPAFLTGGALGAVGAMKAPDQAFFEQFNYLKDTLSRGHEYYAKNPAMLDTAGNPIGPLEEKQIALAQMIDLLKQQGESAVSMFSGKSSEAKQAFDEQVDAMAQYASAFIDLTGGRAPVFPTERMKNFENMEALASDPDVQMIAEVQKDPKYWEAIEAALASTKGDEGQITKRILRKEVNKKFGEKGIAGEEIPFETEVGKAAQFKGAIGEARKAIAEDTDTSKSFMTGKQKKAGRRLTKNYITSAGLDVDTISGDSQYGDLTERAHVNTIKNRLKDKYKEFKDAGDERGGYAYAVAHAASLIIAHPDLDQLERVGDGPERVRASVRDKLQSLLNTGGMGISLQDMRDWGITANPKFSGKKGVFKYAKKEDVDQFTKDVDALVRAYEAAGEIEGDLTPWLKSEIEKIHGRELAKTEIIKEAYSDAEAEYAAWSAELEKTLKRRGKRAEKVAKAEEKVPDKWASIQERVEKEAAKREAQTKKTVRRFQREGAAISKKQEAEQTAAQKARQKNEAGREQTVWDSASEKLIALEESWNAEVSKKRKANKLGKQVDAISGWQASAVKAVGGKFHAALIRDGIKRRIPKKWREKYGVKEEGYDSEKEAETAAMMLQVAVRQGIEDAKAERLAKDKAIAEKAAKKEAEKERKAAEAAAKETEEVETPSESAATPVSEGEATPTPPEAETPTTETTERPTSRPVVRTEAEEEEERRGWVYNKSGGFWTRPRKDAEAEETETERLTKEEAFEKVEENNWEFLRRRGVVVREEVAEEEGGKKYLTAYNTWGQKMEVQDPKGEKNSLLAAFYADEKIFQEWLQAGSRQKVVWPGLSYVLGYGQDGKVNSVTVTDSLFGIIKSYKARIGSVRNKAGNIVYTVKMPADFPYRELDGFFGKRHKSASAAADNAVRWVAHARSMAMKALAYNEFGTAYKEVIRNLVEANKDKIVDKEEVIAALEEESKHLKELHDKVIGGMREAGKLLEENATGLGISGETLMKLNSMVDRLRELNNPVRNVPGEPVLARGSNWNKKDWVLRPISSKRETQSLASEITDGWVNALADYVNAFRKQLQTIEWPTNKTTGQIRPPNWRDFISGNMQKGAWKLAMWERMAELEGFLGEIHDNLKEMGNEKYNPSTQVGLKQMAQKLEKFAEYYEQIQEYGRRMERWIVQLEEREAELISAAVAIKHLDPNEPIFRFVTNQGFDKDGNVTHQTITYRTQNISELEDLVEANEKRIEGKPTAKELLEKMLVENPEDEGRLSLRLQTLLPELALEENTNQAEVIQARKDLQWEQLKNDPDFKKIKFQIGNPNPDTPLMVPLTRQEVRKVKTDKGEAKIEVTYEVWGVYANIKGEDGKIRRAMIATLENEVGSDRYYLRSLTLSNGTDYMLRQHASKNFLEGAWSSVIRIGDNGAKGGALWDWERTKDLDSITDFERVVPDRSLIKGEKGLKELREPNEGWRRRGYNISFYQGDKVGPTVKYRNLDLDKNEDLIRRVLELGAMPAPARHMGWSKGQYTSVGEERTLQWLGQPSEILDPSADPVLKAHGMGVVQETFDLSKTLSGYIYNSLADTSLNRGRAIDRIRNLFTYWNENEAKVLMALNKHYKGMEKEDIIRLLTDKNILARLKTTLEKLGFEEETTTKTRKYGIRIRSTQRDMFNSLSEGAKVKTDEVVYIDEEFIDYVEDLTKINLLSEELWSEDLATNHMTRNKARAKELAKALDEINKRIDPEKRIMFDKALATMWAREIGDFKSQLDALYRAGMTSESTPEQIVAAAEALGIKLSEARRESVSSHMDDFFEKQLGRKNAGITRKEAYELHIASLLKHYLPSPVSISNSLLDYISRDGGKPLFNQLFQDIFGSRFSNNMVDWTFLEKELGERAAVRDGLRTGELDIETVLDWLEDAFQANKDKTTQENLRQDLEFFVHRFLTNFGGVVQDGKAELQVSVGEKTGYRAKDKPEERKPSVVQSGESVLLRDLDQRVREQKTEEYVGENKSKSVIRLGEKDATDNVPRRSVVKEGKPNKDADYEGISVGRGIGQADLSLMADNQHGAYVDGWEGEGVVEKAETAEERRARWSAALTKLVEDYKMVTVRAAEEHYKAQAAQTFMTLLNKVRNDETVTVNQAHKLDTALTRFYRHYSVSEQDTGMPARAHFVESVQELEALYRQYMAKWNQIVNGIWPEPEKQSAKVTRENRLAEGAAARTKTLDRVVTLFKDAIDTSGQGRVQSSGAWIVAIDPARLDLDQIKGQDIAEVWDKLVGRDAVFGLVPATITKMGKTGVALKKLTDPQSIKIYVESVNKGLETIDPLTNIAEKYKPIKTRKPAPGKGTAERLRKVKEELGKLLSHYPAAELALADANSDAYARYQQLLDEQRILEEELTGQLTSFLEGIERESQEEWVDYESQVEPVIDVGKAGDEVSLDELEGSEVAELQGNPSLDTDDNLDDEGTDHMGEDNFYLKRAFINRWISKRLRIPGIDPSLRVADAAKKMQRVLAKRGWKVRIVDKQMVGEAGWWEATTGVATINLAQISNVWELQEVLIHELIGHAAVEQILSRYNINPNTFFAAIRREYNESAKGSEMAMLVEEIANRYGLDLQSNDPKVWVELGREYFAMIAQAKINKQGILRDLPYMIFNWVAEQFGRAKAKLLRQEYVPELGFSKAQVLRTISAAKHEFNGKYQPDRDMQSYKLPRAAMFGGWNGRTHVGAAYQLGMGEDFVALADRIGDYGLSNKGWVKPEVRWYRATAKATAVLQGKRSRHGLALEYGFNDDLAGIKGVSKWGYMMARLARANKVHVELLFQDGPPLLRIDKEGKAVMVPYSAVKKQLLSRSPGIEPVPSLYEAIHKYVGVSEEDIQNFETYLMAINLIGVVESERTRKNKKFTLPDDISEERLYRILADAQAKGHKERWDKAVDIVNRTNWAVLSQIGVRSGVIDGDRAEAWRRYAYVPMFRLFRDDEGAKHLKELLARDPVDVLNEVMSAPGAGEVNPIYEIKGGSGGEFRFKDPLAALTINWMSIMQASVANVSLRKVLLDGMKMAYGQTGKTVTELIGAVARQPKVDDSDDRVAYYMQRGEKIYFRVRDPLLMLSLNSIYQNLDPVYSIPAFESLKRYFTRYITLDPTYRARNFIRDSVMAWTVAGLTPLDTLRGFMATFGPDGEAIRAMLMGGGGYMEFRHIAALGRHGQLGKDLAYITKAELGVKTGVGFGKKYGRNVVMRVVDKYDKWSSQHLENANRVGLALKTMKEMGYDEDMRKAALDATVEQLLKANYESVDLQDFRMQAGANFMKLISRVTPFQNSMQVGFGRYLRAFTNPDYRTHAIVASAITTIGGAMVYAMWGDEPWYKDVLAEYEKEYFLNIPLHNWFKEGDMPEWIMKIPLGFENIWSYNVARKSIDVYRDAMAKKLGGGNDGMAAATEIVKYSFVHFLEIMNVPIPGMDSFTRIPAVDFLYKLAGYDGFKKRAVDAGMQWKEAPMRYRDYTHPMAKWLSWHLKKTMDKEISPLQIEAMMQSFTGWVGEVVLSTTGFMYDGLMGEATAKDKGFKALSDFGIPSPSNDGGWLKRVHTEHMKTGVGGVAAPQRGMGVLADKYYKAMRDSKTNYEYLKAQIAEHYGKEGLDFEDYMDQEFEYGLHSHEAIDYMINTSQKEGNKYWRKVSPAKLQPLRDALNPGMDAAVHFRQVMRALPVMRKSGHITEDQYQDYVTRMNIINRTWMTNKISVIATLAGADSAKDGFARLDMNAAQTVMDQSKAFKRMSKRARELNERYSGKAETLGTQGKSARDVEKILSAWEEVL